MTDTTNMLITTRPYASGVDDDQIRALIGESHATLWRLRAWTLARFDSLRHGHYWQEELAGNVAWMADFRLWDAQDRDDPRQRNLVGVVHPGDGEDGEIVFETDPQWGVIEDEMLAWAEDHYRQTRGHGRLGMEVADWDHERQHLLQGRGWHRTGPCWLHRERALDGNLPEPVLAPGYTLHRLDSGDPADLRRHCAIINAVFHRDITLETMPFIARRPTPHEYWAAVAPGGEFGAWCGIWLDARNGFAEFEPVGTHPDHRRKGLARAVMYQGLRRMREHGMRTAFVAPWHDADANHLYAAVGLEIVATVSQWEKAF